MERLALLGIYFVSGLWAINGGLSTPAVMGHKGYSPRVGAIVGAVAGFLGSLLPGLLVFSLFSAPPGYAVLVSLSTGWLALQLLARFLPTPDQQDDDLPQGDSLRRNIVARHIRGLISSRLFLMSIAVALLALATLIGTIVNKAFGLTAVQYQVEPEALAFTAYEPGAPLGEQDPEQIPAVLAENVRPVRLLELILGRVVNADPEQWESLKNESVSSLLAAHNVPDSIAADTLLADLAPQQAANVLAANMDTPELQELVYTEAGRPLSVLSEAELTTVLAESFSTEELQRLVLTRIVGRDEVTTIPSEPVWRAVRVNDYPPSAAEKPYSMITSAESAQILAANLDRAALEELVVSQAQSGLLRDERPLIRVMRPQEELTTEELATVLARNFSAEQMQQLVLDHLGSAVSEGVDLMSGPLGQVLEGEQFPDELALMPFGRLEAEQGADILMQNLSKERLNELVTEQVGQAAYMVGRPLQNLPESELAAILAEEVRATRLRVLVLDMAGIPQDQWNVVNEQPVREVLTDFEYTDTVADTAINKLTAEQAAHILQRNLEVEALRQVVQAEARGRLLEELPEMTLASILAENVSVERLHVLIVDEVLLAGNPDWPQITLEPALSAAQAADILRRSLDRDTFEALVLSETQANLLASRSDAELAAVLANNVRKDHLQELILTHVVNADPDSRSFTGELTWKVLKGNAYPDELGPMPFDELTAMQSADMLRRNLSRSDAEETLLLEAETRGLDEVPDRALGALLALNVRKARLRVMAYDNVVGGSRENYPTRSQQPLGELLEDKDYPQRLADVSFSELNETQFADLMVRNMDHGELSDVLRSEVLVPNVAQGWPLWESLTDRDSIQELQREKYPRADLEWRSWVNEDFLNSSINYSQPDATGVRPALLGSLLIILITAAVSFPVGVGAAIYLEEYAGDSTLNKIIQTNINNLAGVPSIIYGMLGLAIFVRAMEHFTSGNAFGTTGQNGRTVISAGFTLALLILPIIIINAQEAIRAVPSSLRQASYGLGATQWQTIWNHVLPYAMPGVLTGTILAISRAIGETAPLILVGGATFLTRDPDGPFAQFTALPLVIYRLTTLPQDEFRNAAAAAIVVLLALLLTLNSIAVVLRNRFSRRLT